jgi:uncharacterized protein (TIGR02231 family)
MKNIIVYFICTLCYVSLTGVAQENNIQISAPVKEVTIYLNGAEIRGSTNVNAKVGRNKIILRDLSPNLQDNSFQVTCNDATELLSVTINAVKAKLEDISPEAKVLTDSIAAINQKIERVNNQIDAYATEKDALKRNEYIGGSQSGVSLTELAKAADFFRERTLKINNALTTLKEKLNVLTLNASSKKQLLDKLTKETNATRKEAVIIFNTPKEQRIPFDIRYLVGNAGWAATYDLIAKDVNQPVILKYKAKVYNHTGIPWNEVKVILSTADPTLSATRPYLTAWTLNYTTSANEGLLENRVMGQSLSGRDSVALFDEVAVSELSTSFPITKPYTIPPNGSYVIDITSTSLKASYEYLTIPKVDLSAFLIARISDWEKLNLIDGTANVYFGNTYVGESNINTRLISDTLELSLGRDNQVLVTRAKLEDVGETKFIGTKRTESFKYELQVKNNRTVPITIKIQDQVPVSQESDISVDIEQLSGAHLHSPSGRLQWVKKIPAGENIKHQIAFSVKYPKNRVVPIRQQRVIRTPRYRN